MTTQKTARAENPNSQASGKGVLLLTYGRRD
jgi:hypothetical protein